MNVWTLLCIGTFIVILLCNKGTLEHSNTTDEIALHWKGGSKSWDTHLNDMSVGRFLMCSQINTSGVYSLTTWQHFDKTQLSEQSLNSCNPKSFMSKNDRLLVSYRFITAYLHGTRLQCNTLTSSLLSTQVWMNDYVYVCQWKKIS